MTYSINVRPYNDPYIKTAEEAMAAGAELLIPGAFLVDIIPILKYVPAWFPGAKFQSKAAMMREHATRVRNTPFTATEELMVSDPSLSLGFLLNYLTIRCVRLAAILIPRSSQRHWEISKFPTPLNKILIWWKMLLPWRIWVSPHISSFLFFRLMEQYLRGSGYHSFSNWNFLFGDGLLSRDTEEGSSWTWQSPRWKASRT